MAARSRPSTGKRGGEKGARIATESTRVFLVAGQRLSGGSAEFFCLAQFSCKIILIVIIIFIIIAIAARSSPRPDSDPLRTL